MDQSQQTVPLTPPVPAASYAVPPLSELFSVSWQLMMKKLLNLFLLGLVAFAAAVGAIVVFGALVLAVIFSSGLMSQSSNIADALPLLMRVPPAAWIVLGIIFIAFFVVEVLISNFSTIAPVLLLDQAENRLDIGGLFRKSTGLILPLIVVNLITLLLVWGGLSFFILPALIIGIFLAFSVYEVILGGKRGTAALKSSAQIVSQHFWTFVIRSLAFFVFVLVMVYVVPEVLKNVLPSFIISLYLFVAQLLIQAYSLAFSYVLYRQLKIATDTSRPSRITWMVVIAVIGWLIFILISVAGFLPLMFMR